MKNPLLTTSDPVIFLGGGEFEPQMLTEALIFGNRIVAADGGAAYALAAGQIPDLVIGDLDSLDSATRAAMPEARIHRVSEQETTDFEKCLTRVSAPLVIALGFTGARIDHALAVMNALVAHRGSPCIVLGPEDAVFHAPPEVSLGLPAGTRVSLFPMREVTGRSEGLVWPIAGLRFAPWGRIGTSNAASGETVRLAFNGAGMLVVLPRAHLAAAVAALAARQSTLAGEKVEP